MLSLLSPVFSNGSNIFDILQANLIENTESYYYDPPVDIYEDDTQYVLNLQVPGFKKEFIEITLDQNILIVKGNQTTNSENKKYLIKECLAKKFIRKFKLDSSKIDVDSITSSLENGELTINIQKSLKLKSKKILIE
jgi:HSP20 family protein